MLLTGHTIACYTNSHHIMHTVHYMMTVRVTWFAVFNEEVEKLYMLQPANKSDRMCHLVAMTMRSSCPSSL